MTHYLTTLHESLQVIKGMILWAVGLAVVSQVLSYLGSGIGPEGQGTLRWGSRGALSIPLAERGVNAPPSDPS